MKSLRLAAAALAIALGAVGLVPAATGVGAARADALTVYYTWHYDWRCQWNVVFAGEPFYKGYLYKVWYRTKHVDYAQWETDYYGYRDYSTTSFSYREYSKSFPRCAGGEW